MSIQIKSKLNHTKGEKNNFYVAKITGLHEKFGLDRQFLNRKTEYINGKAVYSVEIGEEGFYDIKETNGTETEQQYIHVIANDNGELTVREIPYSDVKKAFK